MGNFVVLNRYVGNSTKIVLWYQKLWDRNLSGGNMCHHFVSYVGTNLDNTNVRNKTCSFCMLFANTVHISFKILMLMYTLVLKI